MPLYDIAKCNNNNKIKVLVIEIFDKNGKHIFAKENKNQVEIDFFNKTIKMYIVSTNENHKEQMKNLLSIEIDNNKIKHCYLDKNFIISDDYKTVTIDNKIYEIPTFFNREMLKNNDEKTWEMVFNSIFYKEKIITMKQYQN